jgi:hypothetical protein
MRAGAYLLVTLLVLLTLVGSLGPADAASNKPRVILAPVSDTSVCPSGMYKAEGVTEAVRTALQSAIYNNYTMIADTELQKELDADKYNQYLSGDFDPAQAVAIGQKMGAQLLVKCSVVKNEMSARVIDKILWKETEYRMSLSVNLQICDIEKTTVCFMHTAQTEQVTKAKELPSSDGQKPISLSNPKDVRGMAINAIVKELAEKIAQNATRGKGKATVTKVSGAGKEGDSIVIDLGSNQDAVEDMEVKISTLDEDGFEEEIGTATITAVQDDKSKCEITKVKKPVKTGDVVALAKGGSGSPGGGSSGGGDGSVTVVEAEGQGTTKDAATNDALQAAIQQAAGVYILSEQEAQNYEMVKNEMFTQTKGYISKYDPIGSPSTDGGITTVKIRAWVSNKPVYDALLAKKVLSRQRVMVCVPEQHLKLVVPDPAGETEIIKRLIDRNFLVVDQKLSDQIANDEKMRAQLSGDAQKIIGLVANKGTAEILIYGEAFSQGAQRVQTNAGPRFTCGARVEVRAVWTDTGEIIYADSAQATSTDATEELAGKRALKATAEILCKGKDGQPGFVDALSNKLMDTTRYVQCVVSNVKSQEELKDVEEALRDAIGNRPLHRFSYGEGVARINLVTTKTAQDLTGIIAQQQLKGTLKLLSNTVNRIDYQYSK